MLARRFESMTDAEVVKKDRTLATEEQHQKAANSLKKANELLGKFIGAAQGDPPLSTEDLVKNLDSLSNAQRVLSDQVATLARAIEAR